MNKFTTKLTALALLLAGGSQCAWAEDAETDYHFSFAADSINYHAYDAETNTDYYDEENKIFKFGGAYAQIGWSFSPSKDFSGYNYLVFKFAKPVPFYITANIVSSNASYSQDISSGDTVAIVPIKNVDASNITTVYLWASWEWSSATDTTVVLDDAYVTALYKPEQVAISNYEVLGNYASLAFQYDEEGVAEEDTDDVAYGNYCSYTYASNLFETSFGSSNAGNNAVLFHLSEAIDISGYDYLVIELDSETEADVAFMPALAESTSADYYGSTEISICESGSTKYTIALDTCAYTGTTVGTVVILTEYEWWSESGASFDFKSITFVNEKGYYYSDGYYARKAGDGVYGTICLPYAAVADSAKVYEVVGYGATTDDDGNETPSELYLDVVDSLEAGVAYVFQSSANDSIVTFTLTGDSVEAATDNALVGTYSKADVESQYYILTTSTDDNGNVSYVWGKGSGNSVGAHKAYLNLSSSVFTESTTTTEATAKGWISMSLAYDGDDGTTGIKEIVSEEEDGEDDDAIYNLSGVRVTNPQKGIYIKNGKKYIIK